MAAAACRAIGQACQPVAAATSVVRGARGPRLPTRCGNATTDLDAPQPMLGSWMLEPQCTMIRQYPGLAALFKQAAAPEEQEPCKAVEEELQTAAAAEVPANSSEKLPESAEGGDDEAERSRPREERRRGRPRAPVAAAALMMRDYEMRLRSLEMQCRELTSQNARLSSELTAGEVKQQQGRELNLRLSREVQELRRENAEANAKVTSLEEELAMQRELPPLPVLDLQPSCLAEVVEPPPGLARPSNLANLDLQQTHTIPIEEPASFWGCEEMQMYCPSLLLAHRDLSLTTDSGPPGLARPALNGLRTEEVPDVIAHNRWTRPRKVLPQRHRRKHQNKKPAKAAVL